jgi:hypothetical protein
MSRKLTISNPLLSRIKLCPSVSHFIWKRRWLPQSQRRPICHHMLATNFCGPNLNPESAIFRYFWCNSSLFCYNAAQKSIFLRGIFALMQNPNKHLKPRYSRKTSIRKNILLYNSELNFCGIHFKIGAKNWKLPYRWSL